VLALDPIIARHAERFIDREHALFLGRGPSIRLQWKAR
jgi:hypothetical protein